MVGLLARSGPVRAMTTIMMYTAFEDRTDGAEYRFRTMSGLCRQAGGDSYQVEHGSAGPRATVMILKSNRYGTHVVTTLRVDAAALPEESRP